MLQLKNINICVVLHKVMEVHIRVILNIFLCFNGIPALTGKPAVRMGRSTVLRLSVIGMWCCELCVELCTGAIMSAPAGDDDSPSLLPVSVRAALVGNATCACSAAPGGNAELAALAGGASLLDIDGWG